VEISKSFVDEFVELYLNARFTLTERSLESWTKSMNNTAVPKFKSMRSFPFTAVCKVDAFNDAFCSLRRVLETVTYQVRRARIKRGQDSRTSYA
jgi:hypothetical protein